MPPKSRWNETINTTTPAALLLSLCKFAFLCYFSWVPIMPVCNDPVFKKCFHRNNETSLTTYSTCNRCNIYHSLKPPLVVAKDFTLPFFVPIFCSKKCFLLLKTKIPFNSFQTIVKVKENNIFLVLLCTLLFDRNAFSLR